MALSTLWQAKDLWREATLDTPDYLQGDEMKVARFGMMNRAIQLVVAQFYDLLKISYMTAVTSLFSASGKYSTGSGTFTTATSRLSATMSTAFASTDVGNQVTFREGANVYIATITAYVSGTVVEITGDNLPASNVTVDWIMMAGTTPTGNVVSLSSLRMARVGQQVSLEVESTVTESIQYLDTARLAIWRTGQAGNASSIAVAISGVYLYLKKGSSLASYGTLTYRYPRIPDTIAADDDYLDVPDGVVVEMVIVSLRSMIARRMNKNANEDQVIENLVVKLYRTFNIELNAEQLKEKVLALR